MVSRTSDWRGELGRWLMPFLDRLGHSRRTDTPDEFVACPLYLRSLPNFCISAIRRSAARLHFAVTSYRRIGYVEVILLTRNYCLLDDPWRDCREVNVMRCLPCGTEMRFAGVALYQAMVKTRELHTFECPNCRRTERRLVFAHLIGSFPSERMQLASTTLPLVTAAMQKIVRRPFAPSCPRSCSCSQRG
jgi:hypothetical protein